MNKQHLTSERDRYTIKVNKKDLNNNNHKPNNYNIISNNKNINSAKLSKMNACVPLQVTNNLQNYVNNSIISPYSNSCSINSKIKECRNDSNSEEKMRNKNLSIKINDEKNNKDRNILDDLKNNKYLKPILECQDIDRKLLICNLKEPIKNDFNVSLNDFFNRKIKNSLCLKTPKNEINKKPKELYITTNSFNNNINSDYYNNNKNNNNIRNNTYENNRNKYYNDIQMKNNYYNNNEINMINVRTYINNSNNLRSSSKRKKEKDFVCIDNNPKSYYIKERNSSLYRTKYNTYINHNKNSYIYSINNIHHIENNSDQKKIYI